MNVDRWIFPLVMCFICVSSNDEQYHDTCEDLEFCKTQKVVAPLGSSVLLPCTVTNNTLEWVSWFDTTETELVNVSPEGRIKFLDPRSGRVKAFPNQSSKGNFSICIDDLEDSDLGCYHCHQNHTCLQVLLVPETQSKELWLLIYICAGVVGFMLLSACSYLIFSQKKQGNKNNPAGASTEGASAAPQEISVPSVQELQQGLDNSVYENDDCNPTNYHNSHTANHSSVPDVLHDLDCSQSAQSTSGIYPNMNQFNFERAESQRTKQRFHRELMNRLRQTRFSRHYYANQHELSKQQVTSTQAENRQRGAGKIKAKENCEYKNPIYNRSTDQLNRL